MSENQIEFQDWLNKLDDFYRECTKCDDSYVENTGEDCWREYWEDGFTPEEAYIEDCSCA